MKHVPLPLLLAPLLLGFGGQVLADTPIHLTRDASANVTVAVTNIKGDVTVTTWDRNQVEVAGRLGDGAKPLAIEGSNQQMTIKVEPEGGKSGWFNWHNDTAMGSSSLELRVPRNASLSVDTVSAPIGIDGVEGGTIKVGTVSGKIRINARTPSLEVNSVSGGIEYAGHADRANLQTVSGDILAPSIGYDAELQTVSGRIHVGGGPWHKLNLSTVSGDVQLSGGVTGSGSYSIDSMSGDVQLAFPADLSASIHATSFSGDMRSDFGTPKKNDHGPGSELNTTVGSGAGKIKIETFSGDLRIKRGGD